jgi:PTH1 family peptidyl-tRNA hydrolase
MILYVGLGNPGPTYSRTRHNVGFRVIDALVSITGAGIISKKSFEGELYRYGNLLFLKPFTYMNLSGKSVRNVMDFYKISIDNLVVIHDDIDLPLGTIRYKRGGGNGGHNGLRSIDESVGKEYLRVRIGIGKPDCKGQVVSYVLSPFAGQEEEKVEKMVKYAADVCLKLPNLSLEELRSRFSLKTERGLADE